MTLRRWLGPVGAALLAVSVLRCSSFSASDTAGPAAEAGAASSPRTGVYCSPHGRCDAGELCCNNGAGSTVCASDCEVADAAFIVTQCGQKSDCPSGFECCAHTNGGCGAGYWQGSVCKPAGTCELCGDGGGGVLACDQYGSDCPPGKTCSQQYDSYWVCTY
jgi:hypothetical protein